MKKNNSKKNDVNQKRLTNILNLLKVAEHNTRNCYLSNKEIFLNVRLNPSTGEYDLYNVLDNTHITDLISKILFESKFFDKKNDEYKYIGKNVRDDSEKILRSLTDYERRNYKPKKNKTNSVNVVDIDNVNPYLNNSIEVEKIENGGNVNTSTIFPELEKIITTKLDEKLSEYNHTIKNLEDSVENIATALEVIINNQKK